MLMTDVHWALGRRKFEEYGAFIRAVDEYNDQIRADGHGWQSERVISPAPIKIVYEAGWKDVDDLLELMIGEMGAEVTMGMVLFELNNLSYEFFEGADKHFFEGLDPRHAAGWVLQIGS